MTLRRIWDIVTRALRRRCPNCGGHPIFAGWFRMLPACPRCGLALERHESGYTVGAYMFNIVAAELGFAAIFAVIVALTWPSPPWDLLYYGGVGLMVLLPVLTYPFSKTLFLGFDLLFRPAGHRTREVAAPAKSQSE